MRLGIPFGKDEYGQIIFWNRLVALMELVDRICLLKSFTAVTEFFFSDTNTRLTGSVLWVACDSISKIQP